MTRPEANNPLSDLSPAGRAMLEGGVQQICFNSPTSVIHKGQQVSGAYLVTEGQLRVFTYTPQGSEATLYFIRPGETCVLALNCLFNDLRYPAWVETDAGTCVEIVPGPLYRRLFESESSVQDLTVKTLSTLVFRLMDELEQIHACTLDQRLANFILSNVSEAGDLHMTQQTLADHLGTTREVIARLMQGFVAEGLVKTQRGRVTVRDAKRLAGVIKMGT
ncbi:MAG: Crp/Fnr family transcriptional regulator [Candidatus Thiodiazotropha sp. (ex Monitilora ramsayi)]|nr:Crp/Fnr family transcriptional regulator [Candidatus Thiodiazotropha sp. (ex Monitilora ramsayi)]